MRNIKHLLILTMMLVLVPALKVFAGEVVTYEIQMEYCVTNISDKAIMGLPFSFDPGYYALESTYQPDTNVSLHMSTSSAEPLEDYGFVKLYETDIQAGETQSINMTWTFISGDFDQRLFTSDLQESISTEPFLGDNELVDLTRQLTARLSGNREKALAIYTWITQNIKYGEEQNYALPEKANCQTFASLFSSMCQIAEIPCRMVYGYSVKLVDGNNEATYGMSDITEMDMHVWNEFYDEISGWAIADATFDEGKRKFDFFMQGNEQKPHLAMFYDKLPTLMTSTDKEHIEQTEWSRKVTIIRSEFTGKYSQDKNALATYQRIDEENKMLERLFRTQGVSFKINRLTDSVSSSGNILNIPSKYNVAINNSKIVEISYDKKLLRQWKFDKNGLWQLLSTSD